MSKYFSESEPAPISPSAINAWLHCRMKFYYKYVCQLVESDSIKDEIDQMALGNILHDVMKSLYENFEGKIIDKSFLENLISREQTVREEVEKSVKRKFGARYFDDGAVLIVKEALFKYVINILKADIFYSPLKILGIEKGVSFNSENITIGGTADRIDIHNNTVRVVDYKTGSASNSIASISELFEEDRKKEHDGWLQTLLYCESLFGKTEGQLIRPSIYKIKKIGGAHNDILFIKSGKTALEVNDYSAVRDEFMAGLINTINLIFSENEPFIMTHKQDKCKYCAYSGLCMR
jgi:CRISPR/Cas system-associated exonuclease Cas4 (RecB family)